MIKKNSGNQKQELPMAAMIFAALRQYKGSL
jgi:hypothetical protein